MNKFEKERIDLWKRGKVIAWVLIGLLAFFALNFYVYNKYFADQSDEREAFKQNDKKSVELKAENEKLRDEIAQAAGHGVCRFNSDCESIGLGPKICGYHRFYVHYSTADANEHLLKSLISKYNENAEFLNQFTFTVPSCGKLATKTQCYHSVCRVVENE